VRAHSSPRIADRGGETKPDVEDVIIDTFLIYLQYFTDTARSEVGFMHFGETAASGVAMAVVTAQRTLDMVVAAASSVAPAAPTPARSQTR
jgi:hypothetical protein